jgi:hypothetical protein
VPSPGSSSGGGQLATTFCAHALMTAAAASKALIVRLQTFHVEKSGNPCDFHRGLAECARFAACREIAPAQIDSPQSAASVPDRLGFEV